MRILLLVPFLLLTKWGLAQNKVERTFWVDGICGMCEERIESAIDVSGVVYSDWDRETKKLFVVYKPAKIEESELHRLINAVGHDTEASKASEEAYSNIHSCCKYREDDTH